MDGVFEKDELRKAYKAYIRFDRFKRSANDTTDSYIIKFENLYFKKYNMKLNQSVLAFKLLDGILIEHKDR